MAAGALADREINYGQPWITLCANWLSRLTFGNLH
jgi:hypothetical protein